MLPDTVVNPLIKPPNDDWLYHYTTPVCESRGWRTYRSTTLRFQNFSIEHPFKTRRTRQGPTNHRSNFGKSPGKKNIFQISSIKFYHVAAKLETLFLAPGSVVSFGNIQNSQELPLPLQPLVMGSTSVLSITKVIQMMRQRKPGTWSIGPEAGRFARCQRGCTS